MSQDAYKIRGMDCAEEVATLKDALGPVVGGEDRLGFDLINGKLTVENGEVEPEAIKRAVAQTGMKAIPWEEHLQRMEGGERAPVWQEHGREILCGLSGAALLGGFVSHAVIRGLPEALTGPPEGQMYPLLVLGLYIAAVIAGVWYVLPKAWFAAKRLRPDMNLLMTIAIAGAILLGEWFEAGSVAFLFALALLLESWSVARARKAISSLVEMSPRTARFRCPSDGCIEEKPVEEIAVGTTVLVRPGEKIPLDGTIASGSTTVNQAPITGESRPVDKAPGDEVYAGSINQGGAIEFETTKPAEDTTLSRIIRLVEQAHSRRAPSEQWVEKFARYYTPAMMVLALVIAVVPPLIVGEWIAWFYQALVILVIACPCALVISTPVSIVAGLASSARQGVLVKGGVFLETPGRLRAIAFDKTGTITTGRPEVQEIVPLNGHTGDELLQRAAGMEAQSNHPLAAAIRRKAEAGGVEPLAVAEYREIEGRGAEGLIDGRPFWIGSHRLVHEKDLETDEDHRRIERLEDAGHSVVAIGNAEHICGLVSVADAPREDAADAIAELRRAGIEHIVLLTGDNAGTANAIARRLDFDDTFAELLPEEKVEAVERLVERYGKVAMVGDGINDAPALAVSSLGIAMGAAGSDAAIEAGDVALMSDDLGKLPWLIRHSRRTLRIIKQNIAFALGLKLVFILLAFAGLATLWMAIAADMGASLLVIFNALRLLRG